MSRTIYLSQLTVEDIPSLEKLEKETKLTPWGMEECQRILRDFPEYFGCKAVLVPELGRKRVIGFLLARSICEGVEILKLGVYPKHQRQGVGTLLMEAALAEGIRRGCSRCFLEVRKSNENAIRFYRGHKFRIAGIRLNYYAGPIEDAVVMERLL